MGSGSRPFWAFFATSLIATAVGAPVEHCDDAGRPLLDLLLGNLSHVKSHPPEIARKIAAAPPAKQIHVVIINRNILIWLRHQVDFFHSRGYFNIWVFDNASRYPALLRYYAQGPLAVFYAPANWGNLVNGVEELFRKTALPFVLTDPDILPSAACPEDFVEQLLLLAESVGRARAGPHLPCPHPGEDWLRALLAPPPADMALRAWGRRRRLGARLVAEIRREWRQRQSLCKEAPARNLTWPPGAEAPAALRFGREFDTSFQVVLRIGSGHYEKGVSVEGICTARHVPWWLHPSEFTDDLVWYVAFHGSGWQHGHFSKIMAEVFSLALKGEGMVDSHGLGRLRHQAREAAAALNRTRPFRVPECYEGDGQFG
eukprot:CAMPEP_0180473434 /NCGR_PEP_ID=MMETSP1036_2-20121128/30153_1 /TAXON_ID=632150 /ORGANISM="Azadinium spinosum, Strain 3D9" /LENGTH=371 /DNA_ID=CAMNT_0022480707 /DNA_START=1 /DNA_END=1114 /DNA_ORIENTATION=+